MRTPPPPNSPAPSKSGEDPPRRHAPHRSAGILRPASAALQQTIVRKPTGNIYYLDPKLFETGSAASSLRTFYFEPKTTTNKILDDARHLLVGIEHDGNDGRWKFLHWQLVDLYNFRVRLKAEFQASNKDLYRHALILDSR
jgi:hypothetical protein